MMAPRRAGRPRKDAEPVPAALLMRTCETCRSVYTKPSNQPWRRWLVRRFCGTTCIRRKILTTKGILTTVVKMPT